MSSSNNEISILNPKIITYMVDRLTYKDINYLLTIDGNLIEYVKEQTPELCKLAVEQNWKTLQYVKEQTEELCLAAVKQNGRVLEFVKNQTPEICLEAVKQNGLALHYVKEQTPELCLAAVKQDGWALRFVKKQTEDIRLVAIKNRKEEKMVNNKCVSNEMYNIIEQIKNIDLEIAEQKKIMQETISRIEAIYELEDINPNISKYSSDYLEVLRSSVELSNNMIKDLYHKRYKLNKEKGALSLKRFNSEHNNLLSEYTDLFDVCSNCGADVDGDIISFVNELKIYINAVNGEIKSI